MKLIEAKGKLKIGSRFKLGGADTIYTVLALDIKKLSTGNHWDIITDHGRGEDIENGLGFDWGEGHIITILYEAPDEWHALTEENVKKYLGVGDEVELDCHPSKYRTTVKQIIGNSLYVAGGGFFWIDLGYHFRLIRKANPSAPREESPKTATEIMMRLHDDERQTEAMTKCLMALGMHALNNYQPIPNKPSIGSKIMSVFNKFTNAIRVNAMSEADKLLFEAGMKEIEGAYTPEFSSLFRQHEAEEAEKARLAAQEAFAATLVAQIREGKALVEKEEKK